MVTADRVGTEERVSGNSIRFIGQSQIVDPDGNIIYRASKENEEMQTAEINIEKARNKFINSRNNLFTDRRDDIYRL